MSTLGVEKAAESLPLQVMEKLEMDRSYRPGEETEESGVFSNNSGATSHDSSWECIEDEVADPAVFDPPILQSSNLMQKRAEYSLSTIEGDLANSHIGK